MSIDDLIRKHTQKKESKIKPRENGVPQQIKITKNALEKAFRFGPLVEKKVGRTDEWIGFIVGSRNDSEPIIRDVILGQNQVTSGAHCKIDGGSVGAATEEVKQLSGERNEEYYVIGWIHSHAEFGTFHSLTDDRNSMVTLNSVSLNTETVSYYPSKLIDSTPSAEVEEDAVVVKSHSPTDVLYEFHIDDEGLEEIAGKYQWETTLASSCI